MIKYLWSQFAQMSENLVDYNLSELLNMDH
jgi:hypothetical protein